jgi:hypothetical protein
MLQSQLPRIKKPKLLRSNPLRKSLIVQGRDPSTLPDDDDLATPTSGRFRLVSADLNDDANDLPEEIMARLAKIRELALQKYRETHGVPV